MEALNCQNNALSLMDDLLAIMKEKMESGGKQYLEDMDGVALAWALKTYLDFYLRLHYKGGKK